MKDKPLFYAQIVLIILLFYFGSFPSIFRNPPLTVIFTIGALLSVWSAYNLGLDTYTPFPQPRSTSKHVQEGLYKYIRHPMYLAVMLIGLAFLLSNPSFPATIIYLLLIYILDQKATLEEEYLKKIHPTYKSYAQKTKKFVPCLY